MVTLINWCREDFSVGIETLDSQHEELIDIINDFHGAIEEGEGQTVAGDVVEEMRDYSEFHFEAEENAMKRYGYDDIIGHRQEHQLFIGEVERYEDRIDASKPVDPEIIRDYLSTWWSSHIRWVDSDYARFFEDHEIG